MDTRFDFKNEEQKIYEEWEKAGYFQPKADGEPFSIILPPPNANADLHLGHAMYVIEDIMVRFHRMKGDATLWLPGADHAGFETQFVYEKHLAKEDKSRFDFDRETLFKDIWAFVQKNREHMENQLRRLGFSLDWSRKKFTLDENIQNIVYSTFKKLYDAGLIYRGERLVNYCTKDGTSFSDLEVKHEEIEGKLYFIKYSVVGATLAVAQGQAQGLPLQNYITVATTRPETMFGDVAIAVHPGDTRYQPLIGKKVINPTDNREIPIIADEYVTREFGTGALKITPAHDENDFIVGTRHHLPQIQVIGFNGKLNENVPENFRNLNILSAREKVIEELESKGFIEKVEAHKMVVGKCYKCGRVLEPLPLPQWFVKVAPLVTPAIKAIETQEIKFYPKYQKERALGWLNNFHDWNISRQIVWGMRIPAWRCKNCKKWIVTDGEKPITCKECASDNFEQDTDTFDTWFSSGQWPFATLQSFSATDYSRFYPTSVMETAYDILPWWVCRMIMLGIFRTGKIPFKTVYLHGLVRDSKGQKMSKSKGNVVDPIELIEKYGTDALRASLVFGVAQGADSCVAEDKVRAMRNFVTKLWNIGRFILSVIPATSPVIPAKAGIQTFSNANETLDSGFRRNDNASIRENPSTELPFYTKDISGLNNDDRKIIEELETLIKNATYNIEDYEFSAAFNDTYEFVWHRLADWYIERVKERLKNKDSTAFAVLYHTYLNCLKLLHPFMPFVTEALWKQMPKKSDNMLIISKWPL